MLDPIPPHGTPVYRLSDENEKGYEKVYFVRILNYQEQFADLLGGGLQYRACSIISKFTPIEYWLKLLFITPEDCLKNRIEAIKKEQKEHKEYSEENESDWLLRNKIELDTRYEQLARLAIAP